VQASDPSHSSGPPAPVLRRTRVALAVAAIGLAVALGLVLRLADPLSSPVVPAEDPYTHMALVRDHLRTGDLDPLSPKETLYPPGLHGFLAAAVVFSGADLYDLTLFGPSVLGAIGVLGVGLLLWRTAGPVAGFVGALALAVAPEAIFRTTMMSPTALDLAILPFFVYALLRVLAGRLGWAGVAAPMSIFLALAHPWLLAILCAAGAAFLLSAFLFPWPASRGEPLSPMGAAAAIAILGAGLGVALSMPTFGFVLPVPDGVVLPAVGLTVGALALLPALAVALARRQGWTRTSLGPSHLPLGARFGLSLAIGAALVATWTTAQDEGMPEFVDLPHMLGWPILGLAFAALVALPFVSSPVANLAAALAATTLPFVLFNPLHSEFLPHRTVVFLGLALVLLAGVVAGAAAQAAGRALHASAGFLAARRKPDPAASAAGRARSSRRAVGVGGATRPLLLATVPALAVTLLLGGSVYAGTPDAYDGGWYRLYNECELDAFREIAARADAEPGAVLITGDWQAKLVLAALVEDASRVGYIKEAYTSEDRRDGLVAQAEKEGHPLVFVVERHLRAESPDADTAFLASAPWQAAGSWCANMGIPQPRVVAHSTGGPF
jgi:hypothetical protein